MDLLMTGREYTRAHARRTALAAILASCLIITPLVFAAYYRSHYYSDARATITGFSWQRQVHVQQLSWDPASSRWGCPSDSRQCQSSYQQVGTRQQAVGQYCTTYSATYRSCRTQYISLPVYGWVWHYQVPNWHDEYTLNSQGNTRADLYWPSYALTTAGDTPERVGGQDQTYTVIFTDTANSTRTYLLHVPYLKWLNLFTLGTGYTLRVHDQTVVALRMN